MSDSKKDPGKKNNSRQNLRKRNPNLRLVKSDNEQENGNPVKNSVAVKGGGAVKNGNTTAPAESSSRTEDSAKGLVQALPKVKADGKEKAVRKDKDKASGAFRGKDRDRPSDASKERSKATSSEASRGKGKGTSSGASRGKGKETSSEASRGKGKGTSSEASKGKGKETSSGASRGKGKETSSEASKGKGKGTSSEASRGKGKETSSEASKGKGKELPSGVSNEKGKDRPAAADRTVHKSKAGTGGKSSAKDKAKAPAAAKTKNTLKESGRKSRDLWEYGRRPKEERSPGDWYVQHRSLVITGATVLLAALLVAGVYYYIVTTYTVTTVYVDGNIHYTNEEIMDMVMTGRYGKNSLYLAAKYRNKGVEGIPFVEKMDVNILSPDTIRISVYEKALAGYVEYLGRYMYFDKDGIIVESSTVKTSGIPQVTGLDFEYVILHEPLPIGNDEIFRKILNITQLLTKYDLTADKIFFDSTYEVTVYFDGVRVTLGDSEVLDEKFMKLQYILPELEGKQGILRMDNYTEDTRNIPFNQD